MALLFVGLGAGTQPLVTLAAIPFLAAGIVGMLRATRELQVGRDTVTTRTLLGARTSPAADLALTEREKKVFVLARHDNERAVVCVFNGDDEGLRVALLRAGVAAPMAQTGQSHYHRPDAHGRSHGGALRGDRHTEVTGMTVLAVRDHVAGATEYRRQFASAPRTIAAVSGVVVAWALAAMVTISVSVGCLGLAVAALVAVIDAMFATPARVCIESDGRVTLGFWRREKTYAGMALVVTHDVRTGRFSLARQGARRVLVRFHDRDGAAVDAFVAARVEVTSL